MFDDDPMGGRFLLLVAFILGILLVAHLLLYQPVTTGDRAPDTRGVSGGSARKGGD